MSNQDILDNAPKGALGIKIMDGFYRWILKDNTQSKLYHCEDFHNCNQIYRSLADIKRIAELEKSLARSQTFIKCHIEKWKDCRELQPSLQVLARVLTKEQG